MTEENDVETEDEAAAEVEEQPEPKVVGHGVVQDNVSEPGVQHTHQVDEDGEVVATSSHDETEAAAAGTDAPDDADVESEDALVGDAGAGAANDGAGDDGEALTGEEE